MSISDLAGDESFALIERLADAIRIDDDVRIGAEDRARLVKDLYAGPSKCACCTNWVDELQGDVEIEPPKVAPEKSHPLIVRHRILPTRKAARIAVDSIEICNPDVRKVLFDVFGDYDGLLPAVNILVFRAPFRQFFWRWERFEKAIEDEEDEIVKAALIQLRSIVRIELAEAFVVTKELVSNGMITAKHLWTIFPPGEIVYQHHPSGGSGRYGQYYCVGSTAVPPHGLVMCRLELRSIDWDGEEFGIARSPAALYDFPGIRKISSLPTIPAKYVKDGDVVKAKCIERGRNFRKYAGVQYRAYADSRDCEGTTEGGGIKPKPTKRLENRIIIDNEGHTGRKNLRLELLKKNFPSGIRCSTFLISQAPVDLAPPGGHRPLPKKNNLGNPGERYEPEGPFPVRQPRPHYPRYESDLSTSPPPFPTMSRRSSVSSFSSTGSDIPREKKRDKDIKFGNQVELTELQLQLCSSHLYGYCIRDKEWRSFDVSRIRDIEWNNDPFDSLVLPDGYKDLILSFVESQIKEGDAFDDVINGKGGGLVILLAGDPGVGKTMTAESVAEKIQVPLVKLDLAQISLMEASRRYGNDHKQSRRSSRSDEDQGPDELTTTFEEAARWGAVLLIDECDTYLEKRKDDTPHQNYVVSRFLRELEYYPSLLFLTTNREHALDPAVYSRIHLTINYPSLDFPSRLTIWKTFLGREKSVVTEEEITKLAEIEINGRRIKNITKTARIIAKRRGRDIGFDDIKNAMRITEGLMV